MTRIILVHKRHENEIGTTKLLGWLEKHLKKLGHDVVSIEFPPEHGLVNRLLTASTSKPRVYNISKKERKWFDEIKRKNSGSIIIDLHNYPYSPARDESGQLKLVEVTGFEGEGRNPACMLPNVYSPHPSHCAIEIPAVFKKGPSEWEQKKKELIASAAISETRPQTDPHTFWNSPITKDEIDDYLSIVDVNASQKAGLISEYMAKAIAKGIDTEVLPRIRVEQIGYGYY